MSPQKEHWEAKTPLSLEADEGERMEKLAIFPKFSVKQGKTWYEVQKYRRPKFEKAVITNKENKKRNTFSILVCDAT